MWPELRSPKCSRRSLARECVVPPPTTLLIVTLTPCAAVNIRGASSSPQELQATLCVPGLWLCAGPPLSARRLCHKRCQTPLCQAENSPWSSLPTVPSRPYARPSEGPVSSAPSGGMSPSGEPAIDQALPWLH